LAQLADQNNIPIIDAQGNRTFQYQQSKAQLYGFETSLNFHPKVLKGFSMVNNFQLVHGFNQNKEFKNKGNDGAYLPFIPPAQLNIRFIQSIELNKLKLKKILPTFEFEFHSSQHRFMALYGTETFTPSYLLLHTSIQFELSKKAAKPLLIQLFINNLTDKIYQSNMSRLKYFEYFKDERPYASGIYNMGRNIGIKITYHF
jgi:iron complex outermembrane receptor protein